MTELLTAAQMRAIEQAAIASGAVTGLELMERAGAGVVEAVLAEWPGLALTAHRAVVLCGPGNNGGDGFVIARLLHDRGWQVQVFLYGDPDRLPPDARANYERWRTLGVVAPLASHDWRRGWHCDLLVDALFGTGVTRAMPDLGDLFWNMEDMVDCFPVEFGHDIGRPAIVAVDIPSGNCADSGRDFPHEDTHFRFAATAHLTVTFHRAKLGHYLDKGPARAGALRIVDIGLNGGPRPLAGEKPPPGGAVGGCPAVPPGGPVLLIDGPCDDLTKLSGHKFTHGHALILSGPATRCGAARLSARGALRVGAGLVTLGAPDDALPENAARLDAVMLREVTTSDDLTALLQDHRINALCLGPGLGRERAAALVPAALATGRATVLDADALTFLAQSAGSYDPLHAGMHAPLHAQPYAGLHGKCVLTPHAGEFGRLFPDLAAKLADPATSGPAYSKVDATRAAAARAGCVVLFKGPDTVIADPSGKCAINSAAYDCAAPWLATAGSGDVLAGMVAGLLARGFDPYAAATTAAWLHVEAARNFGPGLIAEDIPEQLPVVFRSLNL